MAEVLSQSQIDALLNAVRSGEMDLNESEEEQQDKKYRKYDFSSPRKFTKDRIKMLKGIFENYARIINSRLNARLHSNCDIAVESIEEQRYYEFSNALAEGDVLALVNVSVKGQEDESPVMIYLSTQTALSMMDRLMGGDGAVDDSLPADYSYTDLELRLYEDLITDMISVMGTSWENYMPMPIEFSYNRTDPNPTLSQLLGLDEIVIIIDLKLQFTNIAGRMSICLPGEMLSNIFTEMNKENPMRKAAVESKADEIFENLRDSSLEIRSVLGETQLSLSDLYHLNVGDVIDLGRSEESSIYLDIGGYHWFTGRIGTHKKNMAVRIDDVCYQAEERSE